MCENVRINILCIVGEMYTEILDQFPISSSFNGIVLSRFVTKAYEVFEKMLEWDINILWMIKYVI